MSQFRKKPVVIEAHEFRVGFFEDAAVPQRFKDACCRESDTDATFERPHIHTLEGIHWITVGDWIIEGVQGEFYPCKPDIFGLTYEPLASRAPAVEAHTGPSPQAIEAAAKAQLNRVEQSATALELLVPVLRQRYLNAAKVVLEAAYAIDRVSGLGEPQ